MASVAASSQACSSPPGAPDARPVALLAAFAAAEHVPGGLAAEREHEVVVHLVVTAVQQGDAPGDQCGLAAAGAFGGDPLLWCQGGHVCHDVQYRRASGEVEPGPRVRLNAVAADAGRHGSRVFASRA